MRQIESSNARDLAIWDRLVQSHEAFALASVEFLEEMVDRRVRIATTSARRRRSGASPGRCWTVWPAGCISTTRYYDPSLGRFASADTLIPNPGNPQSLNRYSYVLNNPLLETLHVSR
ncbi:RHS repeat-associated core domain-containing protein [Candidatus Amarolinea dominans]|uniref:RHS repeat-associated core domain-containing protein n=1 Tax=Candidatus Amarolinea dominans TaxID=3140696 RepID=UPI0031CC97CB